MPPSASPAVSLFASDYSLTSPNSPSPPAVSPHRSSADRSLEVVFPAVTSAVTVPTPPEERPPPRLSSRNRKGSADSLEDETEQTTPGQSRRRPSGYHTFEGCMEGGVGHETKSGTYHQGTEKAYHHLNRANDLFAAALKFRPTSSRALLKRATVLTQLASQYQPARVATVSLREARSLFRALVTAAPKSTSARDGLARACSLLSSTLLETEDAADDARKNWEGEIGQLAREALEVLEDVVADRMDTMREGNPDEASVHSTVLAENFLAVADAAIVVSTLAVDLATVDAHVELAEQALDQASNMATITATSGKKSSTSAANLITRVQLASGRSSLERIRHTFLLGVELDEDDFRALTDDMTMLANETRERATKLRGSKGAAASSLAYEAVRQLAEAKVLYASLLRLVWRNRKPRRKSDDDKANQRGSTAGLSTSRTGSIGASSIPEETEDEVAESEGRRPSTGSGRSPATTFKHRQLSLTPRKASRLDSIPDAKAIDFISPTSRSFSDAYSSRQSGSLPQTASGRRGSWMPTTGDGLAGRNRRLSSMTQPLTGPDGISAWDRKASVIRLVQDEESEGLVPSSKLALSAWQLLDGALKQYKLAISLLSSSDLPAITMARSKSEVLYAIAYISMFRASLASRVPTAAERHSSLLVTAEVYATWAAREVGWSFLIEGTKEAQLADRRTNNWRADEMGKRAVMLLVRVWWFRAVTTQTADVDTKASAKDAVEVVVRRMKDLEGVKDGDVVRFKVFITNTEGELEAAEQLFWRSVSRILRGGVGFVMS